MASLLPSGPQFPRLNNGCAEPCLPPTLTRSLDRLDSVDVLLPSKCPSWEEDYNPVSDSLDDSSCISQVRVVGSQMVGGLRELQLSPKRTDIQAQPLLSSPQMLHCASVCSLFPKLPVVCMSAPLGVLWLESSHKA